MAPGLIRLEICAGADGYLRFKNFGSEM